MTSSDMKICALCYQPIRETEFYVQVHQARREKTTMIYVEARPVTDGPTD